VIIENDADLEITVRRLVWGKFFNDGQTCVAPDYVITTPQVKQKLFELFRKTTEQFYGKEIQKSQDYSRIISERHFE
jgi:acyl-CoA reductase-like NAD-dependent aldehyde dehydrogenase